MAYYGWWLFAVAGLDFFVMVWLSGFGVFVVYMVMWFAVADFVCLLVWVVFCLRRVCLLEFVVGLGVCFGDC